MVFRAGLGFRSSGPSSALVGYRARICICTEGGGEGGDKEYINSHFVRGYN